MAKKSPEKKLQERIAQLEQEIRSREEDLAQFRSELVTANRRLESLIGQIKGELATVESLQRILVKTEFPNITGLEFSTKFVPSLVSGGDYFDIFEHDDPMHFGVVAASSSGYATSALFLSVLLKISGRMEARRGSAPHEIVNAIAGELISGLGPQDTIDIFYGLVDRRSFDLHYCRLGNVLAVVQEFATGELKSLPLSGPAIERNFLPMVESHKLALSPGDRLAVCTRGVLEAANSAGESFGVERVLKSIIAGPKRGVHEIRNRILYEVQKYSGLNEPRRDQTIIVAEVKERVIKLARP
jgi:sigma-B regulation protein RsbU (phosphoserine phosphatase)